MTYYMSRKKTLRGRTLHDVLHDGLMRRMVPFSTLYFVAVSLHIHGEFLNDEREKEKDR